MSNGLPGSDMLGGYYSITALSTELFVPVYASVISKGLTDYCCAAAVNTSELSLTDLAFYFTVPASVTALTAHQADAEASIQVNKAISDTWSPIGYALNASTDEIIFYQKETGATYNTLFVESTHRGMRNTVSQNIAIGQTLSFQHTVQCGIQESDEVEIIVSRKNAPLQVTFSHPLLASSLEVNLLAAKDWVAVWLKREIPVIASLKAAADTNLSFDIQVDFT